MESVQSYLGSKRLQKRHEDPHKRSLAEMVYQEAEALNSDLYASFVTEQYMLLGKYVKLRHQVGKEQEAHMSSDHNSEHRSSFSSPGGPVSITHSMPKLTEERPTTHTMVRPPIRIQSETPIAGQLFRHHHQKQQQLSYDEQQPHNYSVAALMGPPPPLRMMVPPPVSRSSFVPYNPSTNFAFNEMYEPISPAPITTAVTTCSNTSSAVNVSMDSSGLPPSASQSTSPCDIPNIRTSTPYATRDIIMPQGPSTPASSDLGSASLNRTGGIGYDFSFTSLLGHLPGPNCYQPVSEPPITATPDDDEHPSTSDEKVLKTSDHDHKDTTGDDDNNINSEKCDEKPTAPIESSSDSGSDDEEGVNVSEN